MKKLVSMIRKRQARITVLGLGRVGLPTAVLFADAGFSVVGVDINERVIQNISSLRIETRELGLKELAQKVVEANKLKATTDALQAVKGADIVIICVQTPITSSKRPNLKFLEHACETVAAGLSKPKLVVIESTVPAGAIENTVVRILEDKSRLMCGESFWLAYCPERIYLGKALQEFAKNPRIVGGYDQKSTTIAAELFKTVTKGRISVTDSASAELAKLAENAFRYVNIGFANELALICEKAGVDVEKVIELANTHSRVQIHKPGPGVGGPCLSKDTYLLNFSTRGEKHRSWVIGGSRNVNEFMPRHVVELVVEALEKVGKNIKDSKIAVLGTAYKEQTADASNSPAKQIVTELKSFGAEVVVYDPFCEESFGVKRAEDLWEAVKGADCLITVTAHKLFQRLSLQKTKALMNERPVIVDGRRIFEPSEAKRLGFIYYGIGRVA